METENLKMLLCKGMDGRPRREGWFDRIYILSKKEQRVVNIKELFLTEILGHSHACRQSSFKCQDSPYNTCNNFFMIYRYMEISPMATQSNDYIER